LIWKFIRSLFPVNTYICTVPVYWFAADSEKYECWFHLYEDSNGVRTAEYIPAAQQHIPAGLKPIAVGRRHKIYNRVLIPWLNHQLTNDDILIYFGFKEKDSSPLLADESEEVTILYPEFGKPKDEK
jgi:hypothetical protein